VSAPFYSTAARVDALYEELRSWRGTPFSENCAVKGSCGGVSCERLQHAVHTATGACPPMELPVVPVEQVRHWHEHNTGSLVLDFLARPELNGRVRRLEPDAALMQGDILLMVVGHTAHHLGVFSWPWVYHVEIPAGVVYFSATNIHRRAVVRSIYRIFE
jgi:hypothetical protein